MSQSNDNENGCICDYKSTKVLRRIRCYSRVNAAYDLWYAFRKLLQAILNHPLESDMNIASIDYRITKSIPIRACLLRLIKAHWMNEGLDQKSNKGPLLMRIIQYLIENTKTRTNVSFSGLRYRSKLIMGD